MVGRRGLATNGAQNTAKNVPQICVFLLKRGIGKRGQNKGLNVWCGGDFLAPTPSVRQPHFETSDDFQERMVLLFFWRSSENGFFRSLGPLGNRLNATLSLLHPVPLNRYRTPSAIWSAIGRPYLTLFRIHTHTGRSSQTLCSKTSCKVQILRDYGVIVSKT